MINVSLLTLEQLNAWCARAHGWTVQGDSIGMPYRVVEGGVDFNVMATERYQPASDTPLGRSQCFELLTDLRGKVSPAFKNYLLGLSELKNTTPQREICESFVRSKYGNEVDHE